MSVTDEQRAAIRGRLMHAIEVACTDAVQAGVPRDEVFHDALAGILFVIVQAGFTRKSILRTTEHLIGTAKKALALPSNEEGGGLLG